MSMRNRKEISSFPFPSIENKNEYKKFHTETKNSRISWLKRALRCDNVPYGKFGIEKILL